MGRRCCILANFSLGCAPARWVGESAVRAPGWIAPLVGGPLDPVALCTTLASVFRHTTHCARQVVTLTGVTAAAELQLTTMGEELTVSCADPALAAMVAWMATGPPGL